MRAIFKIVAICWASSIANAQVVLLDKIYDFVQLKDFVKAEQAIVLAERNPATANDARTFYLKSFIYKELFLIEKSRVKKNSLRSTSLMSLKRCVALDRDGRFKSQTKQLSDFISASIYNDGTESYNNEEFRESTRYFQSFLSLVTSGQTWLDANYFLGSSYYYLNTLDSAQIFLDVVRRKNYDQPALYLDLAYLYLKQENKNLAFKTIAEGLAKYTDYLDLQIAELNILSKFQVYDTLEQKAEKFLASHADNIDVLLLTAATYAKNRKEATRADYFQKSESIYKRLLTMDSSHYDGNYNLGVLYYNEAVDLVNTSNIETNVDELGKLLEKSSHLFEQALPHLLVIYDDQRPNPKLLQALQAIYYNLNMKAQLLEVNAKLKLLNQ